MGVLSLSVVFCGVLSCIARLLNKKCFLNCDVVCISWSFRITVSDMLARVAFRAATAARSVQPRVWNTVASTLTSPGASALAVGPCAFLLPVVLAIPQTARPAASSSTHVHHFLRAAMSTGAPKIDADEGHIHGEREGLTGAYPSILELADWQ